MTQRKSDRPDYPGELAAQCELIALRPPTREHRFHPVRKWRFDLAWPELLLAVEVDGGVWIEGRHSRGAGITDDCEKFNEAACLGWTVLRVTPKQVVDGMALQWVETCYRKREDWL